jgi:predicted transcriptional regulator
MKSEQELLEDISGKMDQLIILTRLSNLKHISQIENEIKKDPIAKLILTLADGSLSSTQLQDEIIKQMKVSKRTIQRRIAELLEKGALKINKKGKELYYENSSLYTL